MAQLLNRNEHEAALARALGRAGSRARRTVQGALEGAQDASALTQAVWDEVAQAYTDMLRGGLEDIFLEAAQGQMDAVGIGVDYDVVNQRAADFARQHSFDLVRGITDNSRNTLQIAVNDYFSQRMTLRDLNARITRTFGPVRAQYISITETTRAATAGEQAVVRELGNLGIQFRHVFHTVGDGHVCVLCDPLNGKVIEDGRFPPLHVGCRCFVSSEPIPMEA